MSAACDVHVSPSIHHLSHFVPWQCPGACGAYFQLLQVKAGAAAWTGHTLRCEAVRGSVLWTMKLHTCWDHSDHSFISSVLVESDKHGKSSSDRNPPFLQTFLQYFCHYMVCRTVLCQHVSEDDSRPTDSAESLRGTAERGQLHSAPSS